MICNLIHLYHSARLLFLAEFIVSIMMNYVTWFCNWVHFMSNLVDMRHNIKYGNLNITRLCMCVYGLGGLMYGLFAWVEKTSKTSSEKIFDVSRKDSAICCCECGKSSSLYPVIIQLFLQNPLEIQTLSLQPCKAFIFYFIAKISRWLLCQLW